MVARKPKWKSWLQLVLVQDRREGRLPRATCRRMTPARGWESTHPYSEWAGTDCSWGGQQRPRAENHTSRSRRGSLMYTTGMLGNPKGKFWLKGVSHYG